MATQREWTYIDETAESSENDNIQTTHRPRKAACIAKMSSLDRKSPADVLFRVGPIRVTKRDRAVVLQSDSCANDTILDFYLQFLEKGFPNPKVHVFHAQFYNALKQAWEGIRAAETVLFGRIERPMHEKVAAAERLFRKPASVMHCDIKTHCILNCDAIFLPICCNEHWFTVCVCNPKNFFLQHLSEAIKAELRSKMTWRKKDANTVAAREESVAKLIFRKPLKAAGNKLEENELNYRKISVSIEQASVQFVPSENLQSFAAEPFLTYYPHLARPSTTIFFLDSLLSPKRASSTSGKYVVQKHMRALLGPIVLFLIRRWHAELCIALDAEKVLDDNSLLNLYVKFHRREGVRWGALCVPQQRRSSLDCGFFALHCIEILRHPGVLDRVLENLLHNEARPEVSTRLFHNIVFNPRICTFNLFDSKTVKRKRKYIAELIKYIDEKVQSKPDGAVFMRCTEKCIDSAVRSTLALLCQSDP